MTGISDNITVDITLGNPQADPGVTNVYFPTLLGAGLDGPTGPTGPRGGQGARGPTGPIGPTGIIGNTGPTGIHGDRYFSEFIIAGGIQVPMMTSYITWNVGPTLAFTPGQTAVLVAASTASGSLQYDVNNKFTAKVLTYNGDTGSIDLYISSRTVDGILGATFGGTLFTNWIINLLAAAAETGPTGPAGTTGPIGVTGPRGPQGFTGPTGILGDVGPTGPGGGQKGDDGPAGPIGLTGPTGVTGPQGLQGADGPQGGIGPTGGTGPIGTPHGPTGITGNVGPIGPTGLTGGTGPDGSAGPAGPTGLIGEDGPTGIIGPTGLMGAVGYFGERGPTGATGPKGDIGPDGPTGDIGGLGPLGPTGAQGVTGPIGPTGATGAIGKPTDKVIARSAQSHAIPVAAATQTVRIYYNASWPELATNLAGFAFARGMVFQLYHSDLVTWVGSVKSVTESISVNEQAGDYIDVEFECVSSTGSGTYGSLANPWDIYLNDSKGEQGATGNLGPPGPQGAASTIIGPTGVTGATGNQGDIGPTGGTGATGNIGDVGPTGATGPTGLFAENVVLLVDSMYSDLVTSSFTSSQKIMGTRVASNFIKLTSTQPTQQTVRRGFASLGGYFEISANSTFTDIVFDSRQTTTLENNFIAPDLNLGSSYYARVDGEDIPNNRFSFSLTTRTPVTGATINVNSNPFGCVYVPTTNQVYTSSLGGTASIEVIDPLSNSVSYQLTTIGANPQGMEYCPSNQRVYVASASASALISLNPTGNAQTNVSMESSVTVGFSPLEVVYCPSNDKLYVTNNASDNVSVVDPHSMTEFTKIDVGSYPRGIEYCSSNNRIYVTNYSNGTVSIINPINNKVVNTLVIGNNPTDVVYCPSNDRLYVSNFSPAAIYVINPHTDTFAYFNGGLGANPLNLEYVPTVDRVYVSNYGSSSISLIDPRSSWHANPTQLGTAVVSSLAVDTTPRGMAYCPTADKIYLTSQGTSRVLEVS